MVSHPGSIDAASPAASIAFRSHVADTSAADGGDGADAGLPRVDRAFEACVRCFPDRIAIADREGDESITYLELNERANRLAAHLRSLGVDRAECVAVLLDRSIDAVVSYLAILKAGCAYVPIEPTYPQLRIERMLRAVGARFVLTRRERGIFAPSQMRVVDLDGDAERIESFAAKDVDRGGSAGDLAYVMFTSGTTGEPKGVLTPHRGISRLAVAPNYIEIREGDSIAHASTIAFDASTFEIWGALLNGATLAIVAKPTLLDPLSLEGEIARRGITVLFLTTSLFVRLVNARPALFGLLRVLLIGGEELPAAAVRTLFAAPRPQRVVNVYGPTEATTFASFHEIVASPDAGDSIPIGRPVSHTRLYVLDEERRPVPAGKLGQLYVGGPGVALGYVDDEELTTQRFVSVVDGAHRSERLYATGDIVRARRDGELIFVGRSDRQRKIRGFRVEPAEIETALRACADVADARVVFAERPQGPRIYAYVQSHGGAPFDLDAIGAAMHARLPHFLVPDVIVPIAAFPLTASGKVDVARLPEPRAESGMAREALRREVPLNEAERFVVDLWERLLGGGPIGLDDDFFACGGDSLVAVTMAAEIERARGRRFAIDRLLLEPTPRALAAALAREEPDDSYRVHRFNEGGSLPPLIFLHGTIYGGGFYARTLARHLGADQPLWSFRPLGVDDTYVPDSIGRMAQTYIDLLVARRAAGPYRLAGYSAGGLIAYEMACRLSAAGESIEHVVLIDPPVPIRALRRFREFSQRFASVAGRRPWMTGALGHLARLPHHIARFRADLSEILCGRTPVAPLQSTPSHALAEVLRRWIRACEAFVPLPYHGASTLLFTAETVATPSQIGDWSRAAPAARVARIPGDHLSCVRDHTAEIAREIARALAPS